MLTTNFFIAPNTKHIKSELRWLKTVSNTFQDVDSGGSL